MIEANTISDAIIQAAEQMSPWEGVAVVLGIAYIILAAKERIECWFAAFFSTLIYTFLFWDVDLLMESALQVYYIAMAIYGWYQWRHRGSREDDQDLKIHTWSIRSHGRIIISLTAITLLSGYLLERYTSAALPYLDSFTTWASVLTTYMVARKVLENWIYWFVIDSAAIYLYIQRELYLTALLFVLYVIIVVFGYLHWLKLYRSQQRDRQPVECAAN